MQFNAIMWFDVMWCGVAAQCSAGIVPLTKRQVRIG
jgi:hypothetical protein